MLFGGFLFSLIIILNSILNTQQYIEKKHIKILKNFSICATFNGESSIYGCQSNEYGNSASVLEVNDIKEIPVLSGSLLNFILLIPYDVFSKLKDEDFKMNRLLGILVQDDKGTLEYDSPESSISNSKNMWNPKGNDLISKDMNIPIFLLKSKTEVDSIKECIKQYQRSCHVTMKSFMYSSGLKNGLCHRRTIQHSLFQDTVFCQPLNGLSIWASINDFTKRSRQPNSVIIVLSRIDSRSIFYQESPSAESVASALSIIMTTSKQLKDIMSNKQYSIDKTFMFLLLNGEAWNNIGSTTFFKNLILKKFPDLDNYLKLEEIDMVIQIDQSALLDSKYYGHLSQTYNENNSNSRHIKEFGEAFNKSLNAFSSSKYSFHFQNSFGLPTFNSLSTFESKDLPVILISDYYDSFKNKFFHSYFDNNEYIQFIEKLCLNNNVDHCETTKKLAIIASSLTYTLFKIALPSSIVEPSSLITTMPNDLIRDHMECLLISNSCQLFKSIFNTTLNNVTVSNHIGSSDGLTTYTYNLLTQLASSIGEQIMINETQTCNNTDLKNLTLKLSKKVCFKFFGSFFKSISPLIQSNQTELDILKDLHVNPSSWHESTWNEQELLLYRVNDEYHEIFFFIMSLVVFVVNLLLIYLMSKKELI